MTIAFIVDRLVRIERIATRPGASRKELLDALDECREETALLRVDIEIESRRGNLAGRETA